MRYRCLIFAASSPQLAPRKQRAKPLEKDALGIKKLSLRNEEDLPPRRPPAPEPRETAEALQAMSQAMDPGGEIDEIDGAREPDLVAVGRFTAPWEAHLARTRLESEGIAACVLEERLPLVNLVSGQLVALSRVAVHAADAVRAREILADAEPAPE